MEIHNPTCWNCRYYGFGREFEPDCAHRCRKIPPRKLHNLTAVKRLYEGKATYNLNWLWVINPADFIEQYADHIGHRVILIDKLGECRSGILQEQPEWVRNYGPDDWLRNIWILDRWVMDRGREEMEKIGIKALRNYPAVIRRPPHFKDAPGCVVAVIDVDTYSPKTHEFRLSSKWNKTIWHSEYFLEAQNDGLPF